MRETPSRLYIDYVLSMYYKNDHAFYTSEGIPQYIVEAIEDGLCVIEEYAPNNFKIKITDLGKETAIKLALIYNL